MKHLLTAVFAVLCASMLRAQCPGCTPNNCASTNPDGGLCDTILIGMANHPMDEQISFYMPTEIYTTLLPGGGYVQLDKIKITGVVGLPLGLNWESNHSPANEYFPQTGDSIGCVRMCGTPLQADTFRLTVYLLADVTAPVVGQVKNNVQTYNNAVVIILPDTAGGVSSFSVSPEIYQSCDPLTLAFEARLTSPTNPVSYAWDFGNGNTATGINPPSQTFSDPGSYPVTLTTTINEYVIRRVRVIQVNGGWTGDIEELTSFLNSPDLYFTLPTLGYTSSEKTNTSTPATWNNLSIHVPIGTSQFEIRIYDKDNGPPLGSQDDSLGSAIIDVATGTFLWTDRNGTVTNGDIVINDTVGTVFSETLDVEIGEKPEPALAVLSNDSICGGDTTVLALSGTGIAQFTWFKDSVFIQGAMDTFYPVTEAGVYWVEAVSASGCEVTTDAEQIKVFSLPRKPSVYYNAAQRLLYTTNASNIPLIQWYQDGVAIAGANAYNYTVTEDGTYTVTYSNVLGCSTASDSTVVTGVTVGISGGMEGMVQLYPNPNEGVFRVELTDAAGECSIIITDNVGRKVYDERVVAGAGFGKTIDLSGAASGLYFFRVMSAKGQRVEKMWIYNNN